MMQHVFEYDYSLREHTLLDVLVFLPTKGHNLSDPVMSHEIYVRVKGIV